MTNRKKFFIGMATGALLTCSILFMVFSVTIGVHDWERTDTTTSTDSPILKKVGLLAGYIEKFSIYPDEDQKMIDGIYKGLVSSIEDPYSRYYTKEEYDELKKESSGVFDGIGVAVQYDSATKVKTIKQFLNNSSAESAGIKIEDVIIKVDNQDVTSMELSDVVELLKGESGTTVNIQIKRVGEDKKEQILDFTLERRKVEAETVSYKMLDNNIGYIKITQFKTNTAKQYEDALSSLKKQGAKGIVFDLRDNPGGLYSSVVTMLDDILPEGTIVYTEDKEGNKEEQKSDSSCLELPYSVIINGNSASASEIFAGAVRDFKTGTLVGTKSFGKGIVQRVFPLEDGSAIKLTIAKYFTPSGVNIHGTGIEPDIQVVLPEGVQSVTKIPDGKDTQLEAAVKAVTKDMDK